MVKRFDPMVRDTAFKRVIDAQSLAENQEKKKVRTSLYASDYGNCMRKVFFQFFPAEYGAAVIDARTARVFSNGNAVHERLGGYLAKDESLNFIAEVPVPRDDLDVHGRCDGIAAVDNRFTIVEFKSINSKGVTEPKEAHEGQLMFYLHMFKVSQDRLREEFGIAEGLVWKKEDFEGVLSSKGRQFSELDRIEQRLLLSEGVPAGELVYEQKPNQGVAGFPIAYDELTAEKVMAWFANVKKHVDEKRCPEVHYAKSSFPCRWFGSRCEFYEQCYGPDGA